MDEAARGTASAALSLQSAILQALVYHGTMDAGRGRFLPRVSEPGTGDSRSWRRIQAALAWVEPK
jgi:hypothetical protein